MIYAVRTYYLLIYVHEALLTLIYAVRTYYLLIGVHEEWYTEEPKETSSPVYSHGVQGVVQPK